MTGWPALGPTLIPSLFKGTNAFFSFLDFAGAEAAAAAAGAAAAGAGAAAFFSVFGALYIG